MSPKKKKKETKPKQIDLELTLQDFGPLREAKVKLKPMTIFIGPNNSGKTYTATIIYSLFQSVERANLRPGDPVRSFQSWESDAKAVHRASKSLARLRENELPSKLDKGTVLELAQVFAKPLAEQLNREINRCFPPAGGQLNRAGTRHFQLDVNSEPLSFIHEQHSKSLQIRPPQGPVKTPEGVGEHLSPSAHGASPDHMDKYMHLADIGSPVLFSAFDRAAYYIPASRVGILRTYRAMTASALDRLEWSDRAQPAGHLAGVDIDLTRYLINLPQAPGPDPFPRIAAEMAKELMGGDIEIMWTDKRVPPIILIKIVEHEIPPNRASSADCAMVPVLLFTAFLVRRGDLLIIDEPEAHLHPGAIRILAKYLVRLVREGVNLIITTHSDYLLEQLNNFILLGKVDPERRKEKYRDYEVDDFLKPEEVGAYVFNYDEQEKGYVTQELAIDEEEGLIEEEFNKVNEALYDELASLRRDVAKKTSN